jgi:hypothetical protein
MHDVLQIINQHFYFINKITGVWIDHRVTDLVRIFHFSDTLVQLRRLHTRFRCVLPLILFYSAATKSLYTEMAPKVGMLVSSNSQFCAESISDCHNDLFTGAAPRILHYVGIIMLADLRRPFLWYDKV